MKKVISSLFLLFHVPCLMAQEYMPVEHHQKASEYQRILQLLRDQESSTAERPTGIKQRVVAQSYHDGGYYDSTIFRYSGNRGSRFNHSTFTYPRILDVVYDSSYPRTIIPFDLLADSIAYMIKDTLYYIDRGIYRQDNRLAELSTDYNPDQYSIYHTRTVRSYNSDGTDKLQYSWEYNTASPLDTNSSVRYLYFNGKHIVDSTFAKEGGIWHLGVVIRYYYNSGGRLSADSTFAMQAGADTLSLVKGTTISYYPDNRVKTFTVQQYSDGILYQNQTDSFGYQIGVPYPTFWSNEAVFPVMSRRNYWQEIRYPGSTGLPDSAIASYTNPNNETSTKRYNYRYNNMDNPERITVFNAGNVVGAPDGYYQFYYETYDDVLSVREAAFQSGISVYPNPFTQDLVVKLAKASASLINCELINALGQVVSTQKIKPQLGDNRIRVQTIPDGVYFLRLWSEDGYLFNQRLLKKEQ